MQRSPEPELMEDEAQAQAYAEADFAEPDACFVGELLERFPALRGPVLDLGCGPANIARRLLAERPDLEVIGLDGSPAMLAQARRLAARELREGRLRLVEGRLPLDARVLDALPRAPTVLSNSLLHHLHDPGVFWEGVRRAGRPGAAVFVRDLRRPDSPQAVEEIVQRHAAAEPEILRRDFRASLFAAFRVEEVQDQLAAAGLAGLRVEVASDRHLRVWGWLPG